MMYVLLLLLSENKTIKIASTISFGSGYSAASNTLVAKEKASEFHGCVMITSSR